LAKIGSEHVYATVADGIAGAYEHRRRVTGPPDDPNPPKRSASPT
jgi:hypothetical protein